MIMLNILSETPPSQHSLKRNALKSGCSVPPRGAMPYPPCWGSPAWCQIPVLPGLLHPGGSDCPHPAKAETGKYFLVPLFSALQTLLKQGSHSLRIVTIPEQQKKSLLNTTPTPPQERGLMLPETADITLFQVLENQVQHFVQSGLQPQSRQLSDNGAQSLGAWWVGLGSPVLSIFVYENTYHVPTGCSPWFPLNYA